MRRTVSGRAGRGRTASEMAEHERRTARGYRCQFCERTSPVKEWKGGGDICPKCGRKYDYLLAQEMDD